MNYCHECGSEIAEIDTFCPFCGISLEPAVEPETTSENQDKTIAVNQTDLQNLAQPSESHPPGGAELSDVSDKDLAESQEPLQEKTNPTIAQQESENIEEDLSDKAQNISAVSSDEEKIEAVESSTEEGEISEPINDYQQVEQSEDLLEDDASQFDATLIDVPRPRVIRNTAESDEKIETEKGDAGSPAIEPVAFEMDEQSASQNANENVENQVEEPTQESGLSEDDFIQTVPYVNYNDLKSKTPVISESEAQHSVNSETESESSREPVIEKPEIPIEENENRDTTFDSVKIIDDGKGENQGEKEKIISTDDVKKSSEKELDVLSVEQEDKERPQTTPNIGVGDTDGRKSPKLKPLDEGTVLNSRYEIVRKIGGGGMGAVYLATDRNLGGILRAVKEMIQSYIEENQQDKAISDFKRESMLLTSLDHPSIPTIYDYFYDEKEGRFYLVMKYISGGDLASRLRAAPEGRIDEETVLGWAIQIADVLDYLHNRQPPIVYRDLKPANIMIDGNTGRTMLIDFGIARWINKEEKGVTAVGTMGYAPPELFSGKVEPSSDIYSLGSTIFHLLTGADPQSNPLLIFDFQKHPRPRQINPQLSDQIEKILMKMVEYNADKRYKSAADVRNALTKHLENYKSGKATFGISKTPSSVSFSEQMVFCGFCGQKIVATDMFCAFCGSKQPLAQQGVQSAEYHLPQTTAKLVVIGTNDLEIPTFLIEKDDNLLGRRDPLSNIFPEIDLSKYDPQTKISRRHAHIWREGNEYFIEDLGSSNGTLVLRIIGDAIKLNPHQPHTLINGEKIKVGDTTLHFVVG